MRTTRKITHEVEVTDQIFCNKCGDDCRLPKGPTTGTPVKWNPKTGNLDTLTQEEGRDRDALEGHTNAYGLIEATVSGGYDSNALEDMESYTFSLCEPCLKVLFDTFKHPPLTRELNWG